MNIEKQVGEIVAGVLAEKDEAIEKGICAWCSKEVNHEDFSDELSRKEYGISGLCQECQECQDATFTQV